MKRLRELIQKNIVEEAPIINQESDLLKEKDMGLQAFLLCPPFNTTSDSPNNPWMKDLPVGERKIDTKKAYKQWSDVYSFLAGDSIVYLLPAQKGLQDQVYVANLGIVLPHKKENIAVISNFTSAPRINEAKHGIEFFTNMGYQVHQTENKFEGEADLKYLKDNVYVGGYGIRSEKETYDWFEKHFDMKVIKVKMEDEYLYHFDCMFTPLNTDNVACVTSKMTRSELRQIEKYAEVHDVDENDAMNGMCNSVVFSRTFITHSNLPSLKTSDETYDEEKHKVESINKLCEKLGFEPLYFDISEFTKSGALMSCLIMHLSYTDFKYPSA